MLVAAIALIVFGPHKLPEVARSVGRTMSELRRVADEIRSEFRDDVAGPDDGFASSAESDDVAVLNAPPPPQGAGGGEIPTAPPESDGTRSSEQEGSSPPPPDGPDG